MKRHSPVLVLLFLLTLAGLSACDIQRRPEVAEVNQGLTELRGDLQSLRKEVAQLRVKLFRQELMRDRYKNATFDPASSEGFSRLDTSVGSFAVSIQDVRPHADGVKVRLHIGNLTTATILGGTFKVKWGPRVPEEKDWLTHYEDWNKALKEKEMNFMDELKPGTWNNVTLTLPGIRPDQFGHLELSMDTDRISLLRTK